MRQMYRFNEGEIVLAGIEVRKWSVRCYVCRGSAGSKRRQRHTLYRSSNLADAMRWWRDHQASDEHSAKKAARIDWANDPARQREQEIWQEIFGTELKRRRAW